eukprot:gene26898-33074_t
MVRASSTARNGNQLEQLVLESGLFRFFWALIKLAGDIILKTLYMGVALAIALKGFDMSIPILEYFGIPLDLYEAIAAFITASAVAVLAFGVVRRRSYQGKLPPGSLGVPFVGEIFAKMAPAGMYAFDRAAKRGSIFKANIMGRSAIIMSGPKNLEFILESEKKVSK